MYNQNEFIELVKPEFNMQNITQLYNNSNFEKKKNIFYRGKSLKT